MSTEASFIPWMRATDAFGLLFTLHNSLHGLYNCKAIVAYRYIEIMKLEHGNQIISKSNKLQQITGTCNQGDPEHRQLLGSDNSFTLMGISVVSSGLAICLATSLRKVTDLLTPFGGRCPGHHARMLARIGFSFLVFIRVCARRGGCRRIAKP